MKSNPTVKPWWQMMVYWDVYQIGAKYVSRDEFQAYRYHPGMPTSNGPIMKFLGSVQAHTAEEAVSIIRGKLHKESA